MLNREIAIQRSQEFFKSDQACERILDVTNCLSNMSRLKILCLLRDGEYNVGEIIEVIGGKPSNISQQVKVLSIAGYIKRRRQEKNIYYSLVDENIRGILDFLQKTYIK